MGASRVVFQGPGPFHLPCAQRATAHALTDSVEVTLYAILEGRIERLEPISFQIGPTRARELAILTLRIRSNPLSHNTLSSGIIDVEGSV